MKHQKPPPLNVKEAQYFTAPLAILHSGRSGLEVLEDCIKFGIVNAGLGYKKAHGAAKFEDYLRYALKRAADNEVPLVPPPIFYLMDAEGVPLTQEHGLELWQAAIVGARLAGVRGGDRMRDIIVWLKHYQPGQVFFRIKSSWMWNAVDTARQKEAPSRGPVQRPISWREFRLLAGLLSARINGCHFAFVGWEMLQATSCGFHSKELFREGRAGLREHCQPLTRQMIRDDTERLEALGFFARCRYSKGKVGGLMAYSFRHPRREDLQAVVQFWGKCDGLKGKTASFRASDRAVFMGAAAEGTKPEHQP